VKAGDDRRDADAGARAQIERVIFVAQREAARNRGSCGPLPVATMMFLPSPYS
jgi:hypothetical protein